jgi:hypothetical protein
VYTESINDFSEFAQFEAFKVTKSIARKSNH